MRGSVTTATRKRTARRELSPAQRRSEIIKIHASTMANMPYYGRWQRRSKKAAPLQRTARFVCSWVIMT